MLAPLSGAVVAEFAAAAWGVPALLIPSNAFNRLELRVDPLALVPASGSAPPATENAALGVPG